MGVRMRATRAFTCASVVMGKKAGKVSIQRAKNAARSPPATRSTRPGGHDRRAGSPNGTGGTAWTLRWLANRASGDPGDIASSAGVARLPERPGRYIGIIPPDHSPRGQKERSIETKQERIE
jgi:hypothetical protein